MILLEYFKCLCYSDYGTKLFIEPVVLVSNLFHQERL